ncbi:MAG: hypothetical protein IPJ67_03710 [Candidatus Moraniibacteriota bacterium]|nr:MAG: hypothetical protein IPJ67_03710 [Candidatus Moranbacteria bacterium]
MQFLIDMFWVATKVVTLVFSRVSWYKGNMQTERCISPAGCMSALLLKRDCSHVTR